MQPLRRLVETESVMSAASLQADPIWHGIWSTSCTAGEGLLHQRAAGAAAGPAQRAQHLGCVSFPLGPIRTQPEQHLKSPSRTQLNVLSAMRLRLALFALALVAAPPALAGCPFARMGNSAAGRNLLMNGGNPWAAPCDVGRLDHQNEHRRARYPQQTPIANAVKQARPKLLDAWAAGPGFLEYRR